MRHADADLLEICFGGLLADLVQQRDRRLAALQGEPLLADELGLQERLEDLGLVELVQDPQVLLAGQRLVRAAPPGPGSTCAAPALEMCMYSMPMVRQ